MVGAQVEAGQEWKPLGKEYLVTASAPTEALLKQFIADTARRSKESEDLSTGSLLWIPRYNVMTADNDEIKDGQFFLPCGWYQVASMCTADLKLQRVAPVHQSIVTELAPSSGSITAAHLKTLPLFEAILEKLVSERKTSTALVQSRQPSPISRPGGPIWGIITSCLLPPNTLGVFSFEFDRGILGLLGSCKSLMVGLGMHPLWITKVLGLSQRHLGAVLSHAELTCAGVARHICLNAARLPDVIRKDPRFLEVLNPATRHQLDEKQQKLVTPPTTEPPPKLRALQLLSTFLLGEPNFRGDTARDPVSAELLALCQLIAKDDPEFVLKLACYVRTTLTFRNTTNFLLATACQIEACRPFIRSALPRCTNLPTDLLELWDFWRKLSGSISLPAALKKGMADKFNEFNEYQLGKYLNAKVPKPPPVAPTQPKSKAKGRGRGRGRGGSAPDMAEAEKAKKAAEEAAERMKDPLQRPLTLKTLIRTVHAGQNHEAVCGVLRKRYPMTAEEFEEMQMGSGGKEFDPKRAGQKLRIPVPLTWETKVSEGGNVPEVWQELVQNKGLPFMAMLRNLRNIIMAGVDERTHRTVIGRLKSKQQVASSKQAPTRFLSAFEALDFDEETLARLQEEAKGEEDFVEETKAYGTGKEAKEVTRQRRVCRNPPTKDLLDRYRDALETAVTISAQNNIAPLECPTGKAVVLVDVSGSMDAPLTQGPKRLHKSAMEPHRRSSGRPIVEGQDVDLEDYFSLAGQRASKKLSVSMIWIGQDLDLSVVVLNKEGKQIERVSYQNTSATGIWHSGDIRNAPHGAEEIITIDLDGLPAETFMLTFTVNVYAGQNLDQLSEAAISIRDDGLEGDSVEGTQEICAYRLTGSVKAVVVGSLTHKETGWVFRCLNTPQDEGATVEALAGKIKREYEAAMAHAATQQKRLVDAALLLALCLRERMGDEKLDIVLFSSPSKEGNPGYKVLRGLGPKVLANVSRCHAIAKQLGRGTVMPVEYLQELSSSGTHVDHLLLLTDGLVAPEKNPGEALSRWLMSYRTQVKPLRFVCVDLLGLGRPALGDGGGDQDVLISGWSEAVLRYLSQEPGAQLREVEDIELPPRAKRTTEEKPGTEKVAQGDTDTLEEEGAGDA